MATEEVDWMNELAARFLSTSDIDLYNFVSRGKKSVTVNARALFLAFEEFISEEMSFLECLDALSDVAKTAGIETYGSPPSQGSLNNCRGQWFELIFFKYFWDELRKHEGDGRDFLRMPSATKKKKITDLFLPEQNKEIRKLRPATSNPDYLVLANLDDLITDLENPWYENFQQVDFFGRVDLTKITAILSIKTESRPDRKYQLLHEANMAKTICSVSYNHNIKFVAVDLVSKKAKEEAFESSSILSMVENKHLGTELSKTIDYSITLNKISDVSKVYSVLFD